MLQRHWRGKVFCAFSSLSFCPVSQRIPAFLLFSTVPQQAHENCFPQEKQRRTTGSGYQFLEVCRACMVHAISTKLSKIIMKACEQQQLRGRRQPNCQGRCPDLRSRWPHFPSHPFYTTVTSPILVPWDKILVLLTHLLQDHIEPKEPSWRENTSREMSALSPLKDSSRMHILPCLRYCDLG